MRYAVYVWRFNDWIEHRVYPTWRAAEDAADALRRQGKLAYSARR